MPIFPIGRARVDVGPADVGRRLTIRYREGLGRPERELVGVLDRWSGGLLDGLLRVRRRDGDEVGVRVGDILAMRVIAPEVSAYAMQRLAQESWPPLEVEDLGSWVLRAARGATGRANSVRVGGAPPRSLKSTLSQVSEWYGARNLAPKLQLTRPNGLEEELDAAGWVGQRSSRLMTVSVSRLATNTAEAAHRSDLDIAVTSQPNGDWLSLVPGYTAATAREFDHAMAAVRPAAFVYCRNVAGQLLGVGHAVTQGEWSGMTTTQTTKQSRRAGIATAVTARMAQWAQEQGTTHWYLQLFEDNAAALGFYERLGFTTHHEYEYRWPHGADAPQS